MGDQMNMALAKVRLVGGKVMLLPISSDAKPEIPPAYLDKWQRTVNLASKALNVPAGLITRLTPKSLDIFVASSQEANPFSAKDSLPLGIGMYCETTTGTRHSLKVPNALKDEAWKDNPSVEFNLISYLGMPLLWPDGEVFGTFCMLDSQEHEFGEIHVELLEHFKATIETDMQMLMEREQLKRMNLEKDFALQEAHHRIKNHLNMISGIIQLRSMNEPCSDKEMEGFMRDLSCRIRAISELHSEISNIDSLRVDLAAFIKRIAGMVVTSICGMDVAIQYALEPVPVSREVFFHIGLLLNELITNSIKHAFQGVDNPGIAIELRNLDEKRFTLVYRDNGKGLAKEQDPTGEESLGMRIIRDIPTKVGGTWTVSFDKGALFEFTLSKQTSREEAAANGI